MGTPLPIAVRLEGRACVVAGAGRAAAGRIQTLLNAGASVRVVAPEGCDLVHELAHAGRIDWRCQTYEAAVLHGASLVVAATDSDAVNAQVCADSRARGILCCNAGEQEAGDFVFASAFRRGDLLIAVSTAGASPALAAQIRDDLAGQFGEEYAEYLEILRRARKLALERAPDSPERRAALRNLAADPAILELLRAGRADEAAAKAIECISSLLD